MSDRKDPIIIAASVRTPLGRFQGELSPLSAPRLGTAVIGAAVERAKIDRALRAPQRGFRVAILSVAVELVVLRGVLAERPHRAPFFVGVLEAIERRVVKNLSVPEAITGTRPGEQIRRVRHTLHAAGDDEIG